ncbi:MAG TPA: AGE family epimerase/isomerase, partial [Chitinophagaceae bacterium]|nr:AGE family epimerase/isomerase [Chitinophagaceae bacterium]
MIDKEKYCRELTAELENILQYWMAHTIDADQGGFYGCIDNDNTISTKAPKGIVLNARILWTFSAAYNYTRDKKYLAIAERAYQYILTHFTDKEYGG